MVMKQTILLILNSFSLILVLVVNGLAESGTLIGGSVGAVSQELDNLFVPAGYAFSIWGLIYLGLTIFLVFQWYSLVKKKDDTILADTGYLFFVANLANVIWIFLWVNRMPGLALLVLLVLLGTLLTVTFSLRLETWDAPVSVIAFVWWPWTIYLGWIVVATVANVAAWLTSLGWSGGPFSESLWVIIILGVATLIYLLLVYTRNMREAALVGIWAFVAIAVKRFESHPEIGMTAIAASAILLIAVGIHGFKNRETNPFLKYKRGEI